jgi:hypothetical protein
MTKLADHFRDQLMDLVREYLLHRDATDDTMEELAEVLDEIQLAVETGNLEDKT